MRNRLKSGPRSAAGGPGRILYGITVPESAATLLRGQLGWFREQGWEVHLATSPGPLLDVVVEREKVVAHSLPMQREVSPVRDLVALLRWVVLLLRVRPDVINVGTPKAGLLGAVAGWLTRVPRRVYILRGLRLEETHGLQRRILWLAERLTILLATDVVCVSHSLRDEARALRLFRPSDQPVVIGHGSSNGVNPARWHFEEADPAAARAEWGVTPDELVVGFVGRIAFAKGVQDLLGALGELDDLPVRGLLVGPVEDEALRPAIAALGERVVCRDGWTSDLDQIYAGIDVLCLPTRKEGFPNVVLEAALAGVPAITTTATGARDSVVPGVTGWLVTAGDVRQLADAIRTCATNRDQVLSAGRAARERVLRDFQPATIWSGLEAVYVRGSSGSV
ncbi:glycosyltransferase family 4 protein [Blastococcus sp. SYSU DS0973]